MFKASATGFPPAAAAPGAIASAGPGGKPVGPVGFVVNCPVVAYVDGAP